MGLTWWNLNVDRPEGRLTGKKYRSRNKRNR